MKTPSRKRIFVGGALLLAGWVLGLLSSGAFRGEGGVAAKPGAAESVEGVWTCSMHHQIQRNKPGKCPICAMDLIPASQLKGKEDAGPRRLAITEEGKKLAGIQTVAVERRLAEAEVRLVGKIDYDETRKKTLAAWFPARIDRLYVDYTGIEVKRDDHLAHVYSPELLTAQKELLSAIKFGSDAGTIRDKLRLWGLSDDKIRAIEERGETSDRMDIDSPLGGIVIQKHVKEGDYRKTGDPLFEIADLSRVWVQLEAYESDLPWLRYGQPVTFAADALPGKTFEGIVAFISPVLDSATRTVKVRVNAENPDFQLKPGMFVHATVLSTFADLGKVVAPALSGKWISPMHPEIIRDEPGPCPICGMALVKAEELGYAVLDESAIRPPLVIPASAVLQTGKRAVVYLEVPDQPQPTFEGREIVLGPRAGDFYLVEEGLKEGDRVVTQGSFKIDSALQIVAKPSMMSPEGEGGGDAGEVFHGWDLSQADFKAVLDAYLPLQAALAGDDEKAARDAVAQLAGLHPVHQFPAAKEVVDRLAGAKNIEELRANFSPLASGLIHLAGHPELATDTPLYQAHCPMAFNNQGADWLQASDSLLNPYFGARMLKCGTIEPIAVEPVEPKSESETESTKQKD